MLAGRKRHRRREGNQQRDSAVVNAGVVMVQPSRLLSCLGENAKVLVR